MPQSQNSLFIPLITTKKIDNFQEKITPQNTTPKFQKLEVKQNSPKQLKPKLGAITHTSITQTYFINHTYAIKPYANLISELQNQQTQHLLKINELETNNELQIILNENIHTLINQQKTILENKFIQALTDHYHQNPPPILSRQLNEFLTNNSLIQSILYPEQLNIDAIKAQYKNINFIPQKQKTFVFTLINHEQILCTLSQLITQIIPSNFTDE